MPELPEVETSKNGIAPFTEGQRVKKMIIRNGALRWPVDDSLPERVTDRIITQVSRRAKYLLLHFSGGNLMIHLGMSGRLRVVNEQQPADKHDHIDLVLANGKCLRFTDPRRFGSWVWSPSELAEKLLNKLGPEPLSSEFDGDYLYRQCKKRKAGIKQVIMDNQVVVGVGNIYATEALFLVGIRPTRAANRLSKAKAHELASLIKDVLAKAIKQGGTTLKDFTQSDGKPGYFKQELLVYGRQGEECLICGQTIKSVRQGQRASAFCPKCQQ
ncbi:bifunctional DNA-formamidopyrimidine glycosylase/DNA-(apurinic or apyrimidinic site) lyase [Pleionea litopenaei]|uniref:Formamidopyrimidine-DNA glycosylase n=1 Tax=Pleionea litopenaei TaxID=3070815 RepID=A0AA51X5V9_9GAMM|nr:bifunctional DNA-formamidopyrimidine glycosylase/DNA-(apurinic or apyrimidinic site) lyase [Pleionea sp. HL-JVS1]WMS86468.1 bifunctional DNA-formamidopyrimidine glycosylase/DNA-(apurinic or apyrimidinic site) lyase [Pleionea sp. HL-JVS1]